MADGYIQVPPDSTGKKIDTSEITVGANTVERHRVNITDPVTASAMAPVTSSGGMLVTVSSGSITLSSAIAISSGTVTTVDSTSQAYSVFMTVTSSAGVQSTSIKASAGVLKGYSIFNTNAAARFFKFYNTASTPAVGTDTPVITLILPGSTAGAGAVQTLDKGVNFATGIAIAVTDAIGTTSTGAISAGDIAANIYYT